MSRIIAIFFIVAATPSQAMPYWHWEDPFNEQETRELQAMVSHAESGLVALLGPLPFDYRVFFHRREHADEPVPWAETRKYVARDVHFHVDMSYPPQAFNEDWTAPHELTHLIFPYLGDRGRWFAEGIASYLQYQVMYANRTITWPESIARLQDRFQAARSQAPDHLSIVDLSRVVNNHGAYVRLYWGGAAYFMQVDKQLFQEKGIRLNTVISQYMHCCFDDEDYSYRQLLRILDRISDSTIFSDTYNTSVVRPGFPGTARALDWLEKHPPDIKTHSSRQPEAD